MNVLQVIQDNTIGRLYILDGETCAWLSISGNNSRPVDDPNSPPEDIDRLKSVLAVPGVYYASLSGTNIEVSIHRTAKWDEVDPLLRDVFRNMPVATPPNWA